MKLSEIINELFESPEMAEYLIDRSEELARYDILQMVCKAPIDIRRKAEILAELSKSENIENEISEEIKNMPPDKADTDSIREFLAQNSYRFNYEYVTKAISLLTADPGDVFTVQEVFFDDNYPKGWDRCHFHVSSSFSNALNFIKEDMQNCDLTWKDKDALFYYEIRKWSPCKDGDYAEIIRYECVNGKVMYFTYEDIEEYPLNGFMPECDLNLITPFKTGDILTVDCTPYKPKRNILILENATNDDCCSLQGLAFDPYKKVYFTGAVKHSSMYREFYLTEISPLYRITKTQEPLTGEDTILTEIQSFLENDPKKGHKMWMWIFDLNNKENRNGVTADEIRDYIKNHTD